MKVGNPTREYIVEPLELPEPLRTAPSVQPEAVPEEVPVEEPVRDGDA